LLSVLWFNVAHYAVRPWPWILTALAAIVLFPGLAHPETGYLLVMNRTLPHWMGGLAIAAFLAAFMSTVATQLNWGASYLVSDFYRRFLRPHASERHYVVVSRAATVLLVIASAWVSVHLTSIASGWEIVMEIGAGTGAVYLLRWYWWRINAWSEISAMAASLAATAALNALHPFHGSSPVVFAKTAMTTTAVTTVVWLAVTLLTSAEPRETLEAFYRLVRPDVRGWRPIVANMESEAIPPTRDLGRNLVAWLLGCAMVYCCLFGTGKLLLHQPRQGIILFAFSALSAWALYRNFVTSFSQEPDVAATTSAVEKQNA
jgi:solute:Na+ symporter, SSS family